MKTYSLELRHAESKNKLNQLPDNRLPAMRKRLETDAEAIAWAQGELLQFARSAGKKRHYQYVEAALMELLPIGVAVEEKDYRRLGRWVSGHEGLHWRATPAGDS